MVQFHKGQQWNKTRLKFTITLICMRSSIIALSKYLASKNYEKAFPEIDEFTLKDFEAEWRTARQRMLNLKFEA